MAETMKNKKGSMKRRCSKTMSGKHIWVETDYPDLHLPKCLACGLRNDSAESKRIAAKMIAEVDNMIEEMIDHHNAWVKEMNGEGRPKKRWWEFDL